MPLFSSSQVRVYARSPSQFFLYFIHKTKMADGRFVVNFHRALLSCSVFVQIDPPRTLYSKYCRCLGSLMVIQQWVHEEMSI